MIERSKNVLFSRSYKNFCERKNKCQQDSIRNFVGRYPLLV